jgi:beta-fructofuranosidase
MRAIHDEDAGWAGCHSIPYLLTVRDGLLRLHPHPDVAARVAHGPAGRAGDTFVSLTTWVPTEGARILLRADDEIVASLIFAQGELRLRRSGATDQSMPASEDTVWILVDGPVLEVCASGTVMGGGIEPVTSLEATAGELR